MPEPIQHAAAPGTDVGAERHTVAVIDCGTESVRAYVAEIAGREAAVIDDLRRPVNAGSAFQKGRLDRRAMDSISGAVGSILTAVAAYGVTRTRAVATSAFRAASNSEVFVEMVANEHKLELEVIDSSEESRLYYEALRGLERRDPAAAELLAGPTVLIDLGAGNTAAGVILEHKLLSTFDDYFGTLRAYDQFVNLKDRLDIVDTIDRYTLGAARMILRRLPVRNHVSTLAVNGREIRALCDLLGGGKQGGNQALTAMSLQALDDWWQRVEPLTPAERATATGRTAHDAALLLMAAAMVRHLAREMELQTVTVPRITLRDGLLADMLPESKGAHYLEREQLLAAALELAQRYDVDAAYAQNTARLAGQIFDQTQNLHGLESRDRTLLEVAALLHDVGSWLNTRSRHKHTLYIIEASDLAGLTSQEKRMVANIARYHRRGLPKPSHPLYMDLPRDRRVCVSMLSAILRLAYALDVEHAQRIRDVRCEPTPDTLLLHLDRRQVGLERWSVLDKSDLFEVVFGLKVDVVPRPQA
jgi:exopolyphosphatase/guanosine-5'-triphosphate,3'-diphosphate pyrophosphatase